MPASLGSLFRGPLSEKPFPDTHPKPPLDHPPAVPSGPIVGHRRKMIGTCASSTPCEEAAEGDEVSLSLGLINQVTLAAPSTVSHQMRWDASYDSSAAMDGSNLLRRVRQGRRCGGVALYVR